MTVVWGGSGRRSHGQVRGREMVPARDLLNDLEVKSEMKFFSQTFFPHKAHT